MVLKWKLVLPWFNEKIELYAASLFCVNASYMGVYVLVSIQGSFENEALEARSTQISKTKHPNLENEAPKSRKRSTQSSKTKHLNLENEAPIENEALENEAPKTRNHCRLNNYNFTSSMTQSESGGGSGCVRTSKGPQNPSQGFIKACQLFN